jgi:hypothetical protein
LSTVTLWGKYQYDVPLTGKETREEAAWKISLAVHEKEGKTKFTSHPRTYNYILECLLRKSCISFRMNGEISEDERYLEAANELNSKSKFEKIPCEKCSGKGCPVCAGHGFVYRKQEYRCGYTQSNTLIIDIDGHDQDNLDAVRRYYQYFLDTEFQIFKTGHGYWLFSKNRCATQEDFVFENCRVFNPELPRIDFDAFKFELLELDGDIGRQEFQRASPEKIRASKYYLVPQELNFDAAFTFLTIKRGRSTIRYTKKNKTDKIEEMKI